MSNMDTRKIIQALDYLAYRQPERTIDNMKAYKLLWLVDRFHIRQYGRTVSGDEYHALPYGVVPSDAKCILEQQKTKLKNSPAEVEKYIEILPEHRYRAKEEPNMRVFSESDIEALDTILEHFNKYSALKLSGLSHTFPEWEHYKKSLEDHQKKNGYKINMNLFFENKKEDSGLFVDSPELLELTKAVYQQYQGY